MKPITIGGLSKRAGVNIETIRYYERIGVLPAPPRTSGGHRLYGEDHLKRLIFVRRSRELGFPEQCMSAGGQNRRFEERRPNGCFLIRKRTLRVAPMNGR